MNFPQEPRQSVKVDENFPVVYKWGKLTETSRPRVWENAEFFDSTGKRIWNINGMEQCRYWDRNVDVFAGIREKDGRLQLTSFSGNSYDLVLNSGEVTFFEVHK